MRVISGEARGHTLKAPKGMTTRPMADKIKGAVFSMLSGLLNTSDREWGQILDMYAGSGSIGIEALSRGAEWADFVEVNAGVCRVISDNLGHTKLSERARVNNRNVAAFLNHPSGPPPAVANKRAAGGLHRRKGGQYRHKAEETAVAEISLGQSIEVAAIPRLDELENSHSDSQELWQYDIIFLDPPYADPKIPETLQHVARSGLVKPGGLVVIGHSPRVTLAQTYAGTLNAPNGAKTPAATVANGSSAVLNLLRHRRHGDSAFSIYIAGDPADFGFATDAASDILEAAEAGEVTEFVNSEDDE